MAAIRYVTSKSALSCIHLQCHVKPGANKQREGIGAVSETVIEVCVSARARDNEANKAVKALFSSVLKVPKTDVEVIRGLKSRDKTIAIQGITGNEQTCIERIRQHLMTALDS